MVESSSTYGNDSAMSKFTFGWLFCVFAGVFYGILQEIGAHAAFMAASFVILAVEEADRRAALRREGSQ